MYITVRTIYDHGEVNTAVKYYYDYEAAKTNLIMQRDILTLELLIKYTKGNVTAKELADYDLKKHGEFIFENDVLEFYDAYNSYLIRYEIKVPENFKESYDAIKTSFLGPL